jgi:HEAT repeat protein
VRSRAVEALVSVFSQVPDKQQAWIDLLRLNNDENSYLRSSGAKALGSAFSQVPDKQKAWNDLLRLTNDENGSVRYSVAEVLYSAFSQVPDKQQAWNDLLRLTSDENDFVRDTVAEVLGSAFSQVPDKQQAGNDLHKLTNDKDRSVRTSSNHSLGRASIFMASQAKTDEDYKNELEKAIEFFEAAAKGAPYLNPAQFCLPFYRSFYTIIFEKQEAKEEVNKYLKEAKAAIKGSESKKQLLGVVENLSYALKEVQNLGKLDFEAKKRELDFYRKYCDHAAERMKDTNEKAPFVTAVLRKGLPLLDRKLKSLLEEIQEKAKITCQKSRGTDTEEIVCAVSREIKNWKIGSQEYLASQIESLVFMFKSYIPNIEENGLIFNRVDQILYEQDIVKQYTLFNNLIPQMIDIQVSKKTTPLLNEIKFLRASVARLIESVDELQNPQEYLNTIQRNLEEIKNDIPEMRREIDKVLYELCSPLSTTQKLKVAIPLIPLLATYEIETNVPKFVADSIDELKNLILRFKK